LISHLHYRIRSNKEKGKKETAKGIAHVDSNVLYDLVFANGIKRKTTIVIKLLVIPF